MLWHSDDCLVGRLFDILLPELDELFTLLILVFSAMLPPYCGSYMRIHAAVDLLM